MDEFYRGPYETAVGDGEMLVEIRVPLHEAHGSAYEKVERRVGDWAVAAAGAALRLEGGTIAEAGIALTAVGARRPSARAQDALGGQAPSEELFAAPPRQSPPRTARPAATSAARSSTSAIWRSELTHRALRRAVARALGEEA